MKAAAQSEQTCGEEFVYRGHDTRHEVASEVLKNCPSLQAPAHIAGNDSQLRCHALLHEFSQGIAVVLVQQPCT